MFQSDLTPVDVSVFPDSLVNHLTLLSLSFFFFYVFATFCCTSGRLKLFHTCIIKHGTESLMRDRKSVTWSWWTLGVLLLWDRTEKTIDFIPGSFILDGFSFIITKYLGFCNIDFTWFLGSLRVEACHIICISIVALIHTYMYIVTFISLHIAFHWTVNSKRTGIFHWLKWT